MAPSISRGRHTAAVDLSSRPGGACQQNDIADREIDAVNHAGHAGRPLVTGEATPGQLQLLAVAAGALALALGAP